MNDDAAELLNKALAGVSDVVYNWTTKKSLTVTDLISGETKEYEIKEIN